MATTYKRLFGPAALGTSTATKYTVPASTVAVIDKIRLQNPQGGSARTFTCSIGADATGTRLFDGVTVPVGGLDLYGPFTLAAAEILAAHADNAAVVMSLFGREIA